MRSFAMIACLLFAVATAVASSAEAPVPPADEAAGLALETSPRHGEWIDIAGTRTWVVYPERKDKAAVVIVIHEIFGLSDWIRSVADRFAADGFIAVAPDLLSGKGPGGGNSDAVPTRDDAVKLVSGLEPAEVTSRLDAVRAYAVGLPAASGRSAVVGFCWGGSRSFAYAATQPALDAAVVFYGPAPSDAAALASVTAPVLGLYGGDDARVNATLPDTAAAMKLHGKSYEQEIYEGAGHGFLRNQSGRDGSNLKAARAAWPRVIEFLRRHAE